MYAGFEPILAEDRQGWNNQHPAFEEIIRTIRPDIVIDVGAWKGALTILFADLLKRHGIGGGVVAVDTFIGSIEHWDRTSGFAGTIPHRGSDGRCYMRSSSATLFSLALRIGSSRCRQPQPLRVCCCAESVSRPV